MARLSATLALHADGAAGYQFFYFFQSCHQGIARCCHRQRAVRGTIIHRSLQIFAGHQAGKGLSIFVLNPLHTNLFRISTSLRRTKTDRVYARTIAAMMMSGVVLKSYTVISYHKAPRLKSLI